MAHIENLTTIYYFNKPMDRIFIEDPLDDPEMEHIRQIEKEDFILNYQKKITSYGILSDEQISDAVQERGGYPPLTIIRSKQVTTHQDCLDAGELLPHEVYRGRF